jgi:hypothetical protein
MLSTGGALSTMERGKVQIGSEILLRIRGEFGKSMECLLADSYSAASVRAHRHIGSRGGGQSPHSAQGKGIAASSKRPSPANVALRSAQPLIAIDTMGYEREIVDKFRRFWYLTNSHAK